jgi:hypothetical protein
VVTGKSVPPLNFNRLETDIGIPCNGYRRCTRQAIFIVRIHNVHECTNEGWPKFSARQLNPDGDSIFFLCHSCTAATVWRIGEMIGEMYGSLPDNIDSDAELACATCGRRILEIHDLISVERLRDGRMHQM